MIKVKRLRLTAIYYFLFLISYLFSGCELFEGSEQGDNLLRQIENDAAWANAARLTVRIEYNERWGTSNPLRGTINADIREGFPFNIEFSASQEFNFAHWRVYSTASLNENWIYDLSLLDDAVRLDSSDNGLIIFPDKTDRGSAGNIIINTKEPVTLIPWCEAEPYILRTVPYDRPKSWHVLTPIIIFFNAPLDPDLVWLLGEGMIDIKTGAEEPYTSINHNYETPVYDRNNYTVTIIPKTGDNIPPLDQNIIMTVGSEIKNRQGRPLKTEIIKWRTENMLSEKGEIEQWSAVYNENSNSISVSWRTQGSGTVRATYRINGTDAIVLSDTGIIINPLITSVITQVIMLKVIYFPKKARYIKNILVISIIAHIATHHKSIFDLNTIQISPHII